MRIFCLLALIIAICGLGAFPFASHAASNDAEDTDNFVFPPLVNEHQQKIEQIQEKYKNDFTAFIEEYTSSDEKKAELKEKLFKLVAEVKSNYEALKNNPRNYLQSLGVKNEDFIKATEEVFKEAPETSVWQESNGVRAKLYSCSRADKDNTLLSGVQISVPNGWFIPSESKNPLFSFVFDDNITAVTMAKPFPKAAFINGKATPFYSEYEIFPFIAALKNPSEPLSIKVLASGKVCSLLNPTVCKKFTFSFAKDMPYSASIPSRQCESIKIARLRSSPSKTMRIDSIVLTSDNRVKITMPEGYEEEKVTVLLENDKGIGFYPPEVSANDGRLIFILDPTDKTAKLDGVKFMLLLGKPNAFIRTEVTPAPEAFAAAQDRNVKPPRLWALADGALLSLFSPLAIFFLALWFRGKRNDFIRAAAEIGVTVIIGFPIIAPYAGTWGAQLSSSYCMLLAIVLLWTATVALYKSPSLKGFGVIFALLVFAAPCSFMADTVNYGDILSFAFVAVGLIFMLFALYWLKKPKIFRNIEYQIFMVPVNVMSLWLLLLLDFAGNDIKDFAIMLGLMICAREALKHGLKKQQTRFFLTALIFAGAAFAFIPYESKIKPHADSDVNPQKVTEAIANGKSVYVNTYASWCLSCEVGRFLVMENPVFGKMIKSGRMEVMTLDPVTDYAAELARRFDADVLPLNVIFSPKAKSGMLLPTLLLDSETNFYASKL